jgi:chaperonin GroEL
MKIVAAGTNPVQLTRGMEKTVAALVKELKDLSTEVNNDKDLANVASVSAGELQCCNDHDMPCITIGDVQC